MFSSLLAFDRHLGRGSTSQTDLLVLNREGGVNIGTMVGNYRMQEFMQGSTLYPRLRRASMFLAPQNY